MRTKQTMSPDSFLCQLSKSENRESLIPFCFTTRSSSFLPSPDHNHAPCFIDTICFSAILAHADFYCFNLFFCPPTRFLLSVSLSHPSLAKCPVCITELVITTENHCTHLFTVVFFLLEYKLHELRAISCLLLSLYSSNSMGHIVDS